MTDQKDYLRLPEVLEPWCKIAAFLHPEQVEKEKG